VIATIERLRLALRDALLRVRRLQSDCVVLLFGFPFFVSIFRSGFNSGSIFGCIFQFCVGKIGPISRCRGGLGGDKDGPVSL